MKKQFLVICAAVLAASLCACSGQGAGETSESVPSETIIHEIASQTTIYGKVDSIVGNEVTLELGEPAQGTAPEEDAGSRDESGVSAESGDSSEKSSMSMPEGAPDGMSMPEGGMPDGMSMPEGGMPDGMSRPEGGMPDGMSMPEGGGMGGGRTVELTYSGETGTYLLPAGMSIGTGDYSSISKGMVISITTATFEDGSEAIISCSILSK